jgi:hypothetical protein
VLEITEALEEFLLNRELRAEVWALSRQDQGDKSSPCIGFYVETLEEGKIPPPFDVESVLKRVWHVHSLKLDVPNPYPRRVVAEASADEAPHLPQELQAPSAREANEEEWRAFSEQLRKGSRPTPSAKPAQQTPLPGEPSRNGTHK